MKRAIVPVLLFFCVFLLPHRAYAYQPVVENRPDVIISTPQDLYELAMKTGDPTFAAYAIFGSLKQPGEVDMYVFITAKDDTIPLEVDVPAKNQYAGLRPTAVLIGPYVSQNKNAALPFAIPLEKTVLVVPSPEDARMRTFDLMSLSWYFEGTRAMIPVASGEIYYLAVFDPAGATGEYIVKLGATENFSQSVMSTVPVVEPGSLVFDTTRPEDRQRALDDQMFRAQMAKQWFFVQKTPFETLDSRIKLFFDLVGFYILRIPSFLK
jgi:hypothetical protein